MKRWCTERKLINTERVAIYILAKSAGCRVSTTCHELNDTHCSIVYDVSPSDEFPVVIFTSHSTGYYNSEVVSISFEDAIKYFEELIKYRDNGEGEDTSNADQQ